jgi:hypothetical protein
VKRKIAAVYAMLVGALMVAQWIMFIAIGQVPELQTEPVRISFHLAGEFLTAILLVTGGLGLITGRKWGLNIYLVAMGMLLYTIIVSPGYFAQLGQWAFTGMFAVLLVLTVGFIVLALRSGNEFESVN